MRSGAKLRNEQKCSKRAANSKMAANSKITGFLMKIVFFGNIFILFNQCEHLFDYSIALRDIYDIKNSFIVSYFNGNTRWMPLT